MNYRPQPNQPPLVIDLTSLIEAGIIDFMFDLAEPNELLPRVQDSKQTIEMVLHDIKEQGEW